MRILVVATKIRLPGAHGGSTHVGELISHLRRHGPTLALTQRGSTAESCVGVGNDLGHPAGLRHLLPLAELPAALRAARAYHPDVIYERGSSYGLGAMISMALGVPMLCMVLDEHISPLSLHRARYVIATDLERIPAAYRSKGVRVSWGANTELFNPSVDGGPARQRLGLGDAYVVGYSGSFKKWHGLDTLVDTVAMLRDLPLRAMLVGDGPMRPVIEAAAKRAGVEDRFVFTGSVPYPEVPALLAAANVTVAPFDPSQHPTSSRERFALDPLKLFEYFALGKPVITVRTANIEALFQDGKQITLVPPADATALAAAIRWHIDHPAEAAVRAARGRDKVLAHHTWDAHARHLVSLFETMCGEKS